MIQRFQEIQDSKHNVNDLEQQINNLNIQNIELREKALNYKGKYEEIVRLSQEMEQTARIALNERDMMEEKLRQIMAEAEKDKEISLSQITSLERYIDIISEDLRNAREELDQRISEFFQKENEYKLALDTSMHQNVELQQKIDKLEEEKNFEILKLEALIDQERARCEAADNERQKIQEEYDTLNQTLNYTANQLAEKKKLYNELLNKVFHNDISLFLIGKTRKGEESRIARKASSTGRFNPFSAKANK